MARELDEASARARVAALALRDDGERRRVICGLVGHSQIVDEAGEGDTWRVHCARCGQRLDEDPQWSAGYAVFRQHWAAGCADCRKAEQRLTWRDLWEVQLGQTDGRG